MLKTYQFKTQCKGDIHSSKTANILTLTFWVPCCIPVRWLYGTVPDL